MQRYELSRMNLNAVAFGGDNKNAFVVINRGNPETAFNDFVDRGMRCHDFNSEH